MFTSSNEHDNRFITGFVTRMVQQVEQELLTLPGHKFNSGFKGIRVAQSVVFCVVFYTSFFGGSFFFVSILVIVLSVHFSIYGFWLHHWYIQTVLIII